MNELPFSPYTKRIPIWGLGCAGGASGLARAAEYCKAYPEAFVLVIAAELCSLTFQPEDKTKSNLIGTSLFGDGIAAALLCGEKADRRMSKLKLAPKIMDAQSVLMKQSEDVMGWDFTDQGFKVIFSRDIPTLVEKWLKTNVQIFWTNISCHSMISVFFWRIQAEKSDRCIHQKSRAVVRKAFICAKHFAKARKYVFSYNLVCDQRPSAERT